MMQWYVSQGGDVTGPMDAATVRDAIRAGTIGRGVHVRDEGGQWTPIEQSPFGETLAGALGKAGGGNGLGYAVLLLPLAATALVWLWVARMNLLQDPAGTLAVVSVGTVGLCALLIAVEASQLQMGKALNSKGKKDSGPVAWFIATLLLFVIAHPWYLSTRGKYGRKSLVIGGILSAAVFSGSVLLLGAAIENRKTTLRRNAAELQREAAELKELSELATQVRAAQANPQEARARKARAVWEEFDNLSGETFRTKEMLAAFLMRANQVATALPEDEASEILAFNGAHYRYRLATLLVAGERGQAIGDDFSTLVPSLDAERCEKLALAWLRGPMANDLQEVGFRGLQCGTRIWTWE